MKVINLNSNYELTEAQINFAESVIICGDKHISHDSIYILMNQIPVFLLNEENMPDIYYERFREEYKKLEGYFKEYFKEYERNRNNIKPKLSPPFEYLGFYQTSYSILGIDIPIIGLCPERIIQCASNDEELIILIASVLIHEFAHALMDSYPHANYHPIDEFYWWMEEPMANLITLEYFENFERCRRYRYYTHRRFNRDGRTQFAHVNTLISPFNYVKDFISHQPDNYRLGLDLHKHRIIQWWCWRSSKDDIQQKTKEKQNWLQYVKAYVGKTDEQTLEKLFDDLCK